jgi:hypothetical protein
MRLIDVFYAAALVVLLGWLVVGSALDSERPGDSGADERAASSRPAIGAPSPQPWPAARATVDERNFQIFVAGSPDVWSVAVSEDD